jgi:trehalose 6-phosphate phosphatase
MAEPSLNRALELGRAALAHRPSGLLADLDGTLAPIVSDPSAVRLAPGAADALEALAASGVLVGIVTGRAAADARRIVGRDSLFVAGNHGVEWLEPGAGAPVAPADLAGVPASLDRVLAAVPDVPGVSVEHKGISAAVHYRNATDPAAARERIVAALTPVVSDDLELRDGRMIVEVRAPSVGDKGTAVRTIVERFGLRGLVVLGDDITDLDMFRAAHELHRDGTLEAAAVIAVGGVGGEVPPEVLDAADAVVPSPTEVVTVLTGLADA